MVVAEEATAAIRKIWSHRRGLKFSLLCILVLGFGVLFFWDHKTVLVNAGLKSLKDRGFRQSRVTGPLQDIDWYQVSFSGSLISDFTIQNFRMDGLSIRRTHLQNGVFKEGVMNGAHFLNSNMTGVEFSNLSLKGAIFDHTVLRKVKFFDVDLTDSQFLFCDFQGVEFDEKTQLPFSKQMALALGMKNVSTKP